MRSPNQINILIACEESQRTCTEFRKLGFNAFSADIQECSGGHPEWHILGDVLPILGGGCEFITQNGDKHKISGKWDLIIAHPPCTFLTLAGNRWFDVEKYGDKARKRIQDRAEAIEFFMKFANADCDHIVIENPIGVMSTAYRKPDQIIHPYYFGEPVSKSTCLWTKNMPLIVKTNVVKPDMSDYSRGFFTARDENGKIISWNDPRTKVARSKTFIGIAKAWATQYGEFLLGLEE